MTIVENFPSFYFKKQYLCTGFPGASSRRNGKSGLRLEGNPCANNFNRLAPAIIY